MKIRNKNQKLTMTENNDEEFDGTETDWLANCYMGYGFGYTAGQALIAMAANVSPSDEPVTVDLIEHVGGATVSPSGSRVDTYVDGRRIEIQPEDFRSLRDAAINATIDAETVLDDPDNLVKEDLRDNE